MSPLQQDLIDIKDQTTTNVRLSLTELARGKQWRSELSEVGVMEVMDRNETAGWLISEPRMRQINAAIERLEMDMEDSIVDAMFESREDMDDWASGADLVDKALGIFRAEGESIEKVLDAGA